MFFKRKSGSSPTSAQACKVTIEMEGIPNSLFTTTLKPEEPVNKAFKAWAAHFQLVDEGVEWHIWNNRNLLDLAQPIQGTETLREIQLQIEGCSLPRRVIVKDVHFVATCRALSLPPHILSLVFPSVGLEAATPMRQQEQEQQAQQQEKESSAIAMEEEEAHGDTTTSPITTTQSVLQDYNLFRKILSFGPLDLPLDIARVALINKSCAQHIYNLMATTPLGTNACRIQHAITTTEARIAMQTLFAAVRRPPAHLRKHITHPYVGTIAFGGGGNYHSTLTLFAGQLRLPAVGPHSYTFLLRQAVWNMMGEEFIHASIYFTRTPAAAAATATATTTTTTTSHTLPSFTELYSITLLDIIRQPCCLNLPVFLELRASLRAAFPSLTSLSDAQLLILLTYIACPGPVAMADLNCGFGGQTTWESLVEAISCSFSNTCAMPGHPDRNNTTASDASGSMTTAALPPQNARLWPPEPDAFDVDVWQFQGIAPAVDRTRGALEFLTVALDAVRQFMASG